jgi:hypothetical protein
VSNHLAIANVTAALKKVLGDVADKAISGAQATTNRPDVIPDINTPTVNIFLYQVSPNAALRNDDLPTRRDEGTLAQRPRAALDLHYLLTAFGKDSDLIPQQLLGAVVRALHSTPVLLRTTIRDTLTGSDLFLAPESVKFTLVPLSLEELSKLWSIFFQTRYTLSVAYLASVVVIEAEETPSSPLPVQESRVVVVPSLGPVIERIASQATAASPIIDNQPILSTYTLHVIGSHLRGDNTQVRVGENFVAPTTLRDDRVTLDLSALPAAELRAGLHPLQIVQDIDFGAPSGTHSAFESNGAAFLLAPKLTSASYDSATTKVTVKVQPQVFKNQRLALALNETPAPAPPNRRANAFAFSAVADADSATQKIATPGVASGTYLVRLRVDGAESPVDPTITVTVPP